MMILDTDVLSAFIKPSANERIVTWLDEQPRSELCVTSVTLFEILSGIAAMDEGRKRAALRASLEDAVRHVFAGRVFPFDEPAARVASDLYGLRRKGGIIVGPADTQIAGIAVSRGATLVTRNVRHFPDLSVSVINPWEAQ